MKQVAIRPSDLGSAKVYQKHDSGKDRQYSRVFQARNFFTKNKRENLSCQMWRRGWDSNPRYSMTCITV